MKKEIKEFLQESNRIEGEYSSVADHDAYEAWNYAFKNRGKINIAYILEIHRLLMRHLRPDIAGKIRDCDVYIGGQRKPFISESLIEGELLMRVCFEIIMRGALDKRKKAKEVHIAFENIHPFQDGNGRVGRILYNIHRLKLGLLIYIIHSGEEQSEYYGWFR